MDVTAVTPVRLQEIVAIPDSTRRERFAVSANQTLDGQVVSVEGDTVIVSIGQQRVPAQAGAGTTLRPGEAIRLFVRDVDPDQVIMQIVARGASMQTMRSLTTQDLRAELTGLGLTPDDPAVEIARALINRGLPVTAQNVLEVRTGLARLGPGVGADDLDAAVFLKGQGLPITADGVQIVRQALQSRSALGAQVEGLRRSLADLAFRLTSQGVEPEPRRLVVTIGPGSRAGGDGIAADGADGRPVVANGAAAASTPARAPAAAGGEAEPGDDASAVGAPSRRAPATVTASAPDATSHAAAAATTTVEGDPSASETAGQLPAGAARLNAPLADADGAVPIVVPASQDAPELGATPVIPASQDASESGAPAVEAPPLSDEPAPVVASRAPAVDAAVADDIASPGTGAAPAQASSGEMTRPTTSTTSSSASPARDAAAELNDAAASLDAANAALGEPDAAPTPSPGPSRAAGSARAPTGSAAEPQSSNGIDEAAEPSLPRLLSAVAEVLDRLPLLDDRSVDRGPDSLASEIRRVIADHGTPVEAKLARVLEGLAGRGDLTQLLANDLKSSLQALVQETREQLMTADRLPPETVRDLRSAARQAEGLLGQVELQQLANAAPRSDGQQPSYLVFQLPIPGGREPQSAQIRIRQDADGRSSRIDPNNVHVVFQLELQNLRTVRVGIRVVDRHISCQMGSSDPAATELLAEHAPELREGLAGLGYVVEPIKTAVLTAADLVPPVGEVPVASASRPAMRVDARA